MKIRFVHIIFSILLTACSGYEDSNSDLGQLYPSPQTRLVNTTEGYSVNPATGKDVELVILQKGDTLISGQAIQAAGNRIHPDSVLSPKVVVSELPINYVNIHPNTYVLSNENIGISVNHDSLITKNVHEALENDSSYTFITNLGFRLQTGIPIPVNGKLVPVKHPQSKKALSPIYKDAAYINLQNLDVDQGLSSSNVLAIIEDSRGDIWLGTQGGGATKYDGQSFTEYTTDNGLSGNIIYDIIEDKNGNIWFATFDGGACKYDGQSFTHFTEEEGLINNLVHSILEDKEGNIWFSTQDGVTKYELPKKSESGTFTHFTENEGLSSNIVFSITEDRNGNLWFCTQGGGVNKYVSKSEDGSGSFTHFTDRDGLSNNIVLSGLEDKNGNLWFITYGGGVNKYKPNADGQSGVLSHFTQNEGLSNNIVRSIAEDHAGNLWFGTQGGGVCQFTPKEENRHGFFTYITEQEGLSNNVVMAVYPDKSGNIWFGTKGGGVNKYNGQSFLNFAQNDPISSGVEDVVESSDGNLWFATRSGGLYNYYRQTNGYGGTLSSFTAENGLLSNRCTAMIIDREDNLWLATRDAGVMKYDFPEGATKGTFTYFTVAEGLSTNSIYSILEDAEGNLWFGTYGEGLTCYSPAKNKEAAVFTHYTETVGFSSLVVYTAIEDRNGNLWFGTQGGVSKYQKPSNGKEGFFVHFTEKEGLSSNIVLSILEDKDGDLWFGTYGGGVCKYSESEKERASFTYFTEKEGLSSNTVRSILEDEKGHIWLSTEKGINEIVRTNEDYVIKRFGKSDGLKGISYLNNSAFLDSKNQLWWGGDKSLVQLDLTTRSIAKNSPEVFLRRLDNNEAFINYRKELDSSILGISFDSVEPFENYPLHLELPSNQNHLTFYFSAVEWKAPHKIQYSYLMAGLDTIWSQPSAETKADFRNLPYGSFTFKVRAIGENGIWSEAFEYDFVIHPPWYHTWWARICYTLLTLTFVFGFVRWRTAQLKSRQVELETEIRNATHEIILQKEKIELAHKETQRQKEIIEETHREITDSINYAERIQRSFLASKDLLNNYLNEYFVYFNPKEAVSGDFYWAGEMPNGNFGLCCADSTGHGVPGAIMSILNISSIEKAVEKGLYNPADIFNLTRQLIIERLKKDGSSDGGKDGMDASLISFNPERNKMSYVSANNPIWIIRKGELIEIKGEKMPVGKHALDQTPFTGGEITLEKGDLIYILTDGFQDQFGGAKGKKFKVKPFKNLLLENANLPIDHLQKLIAKQFEDWKGSFEQVDDVCLIGVRI